MPNSFLQFILALVLVCLLNACGEPDPPASVILDIPVVKVTYQDV